MRNVSCLLPVMHEGEGKWKGKVGWFLGLLIHEEKVEGKKRKLFRFF